MDKKSSEFVLHDAITEKQFRLPVNRITIEHHKRIAKCKKRLEWQCDIAVSTDDVDRLHAKLKSEKRQILDELNTVESLKIDFNDDDGIMLSTYGYVIKFRHSE